MSELLSRAPCGEVVDCDLDHYKVTTMKDGGMGSVRFTEHVSGRRIEKFGRELTTAYFSDSDGIPVSVAINIDPDGYLFELDVWKIDFSPLITWPSPESISDTPVNEM